ncbi:MAG: ribose 5-phosphate isomerase B [Gemmatimonadota bacterium]
MAGLVMGQLRVLTPAEEAKIRDMVRRVVLRTVGVSDSAAPAGRRASKAPRRSQDRGLVTEGDVAGVPAGGTLEIPAGALVSPLAREVAANRGISVIEGAARTAGTSTLPSAAPRPASRPAAPSPSRVSEPAASAVGTRAVALGSDHGGFELKEALKSHIQKLGYAVIDCGTDSSDAVDYPDFAFAAAQLVAQGRAWRGILVDGAGIGSCMAANKVPGVRAAMCYDQATAVNSREHNDANVLTLGAGMIDQQLGRQIVRTWLETPTGGGRHERRVNKIMDIEQRFLRS